jgi:2OG-Fe(II) oxygenase superfamily
MQSKTASVLRTKSLPVDPLIRVYDEFIEGGTLRRDLSRAHDSLRPHTKLGAAVWTVDMPGCQDAPTAIRRFARLVLACVDSEGIRAVEYWTNTIHAGSGIPSHIDKDEWLYRQTRTVVSPVTIAVYYADQCRFEGGELEVARVRIAACPNRLIIFAGHLEHQVHNVDTGIRRSLVVNAWRSPPSPPPGSN